MKTELQQMTEIEFADKARRRIRDLGWGNGWTETPQVVKDCADREHAVTEINLGSCVHQVTCAECGYTYKYDSGDCGT